MGNSPPLPLSPPIHSHYLFTLTSFPLSHLHGQLSTFTSITSNPLSLPLYSHILSTLTSPSATLHLYLYHLQSTLTTSLLSHPFHSPLSPLHSGLLCTLTSFPLPPPFHSHLSTL